MNSFALFTDVSLDPRRRRGVGAALMLPAAFLEVPPGRIARADIARRLKVRRFENTSSTRLEVQTVLWALEEMQHTPPAGSRVALQVYTDSQCVAGLPARRAKLSACGFLSRKTGQPLRNADLYRGFYEYYDRIGFAINKVSGHLPASSRNTVQHIFACVDREVRKALTSWARELA